MVVAGFVTALSSLSSASAALPFTIGAAADLIPVAVFLHVFLAFPTGRLDGGLERALVGAAYAVAVGVQLLGLMLGGSGTENVLALASEPDAGPPSGAGPAGRARGDLRRGVGVLATRRRLRRAARSAAPPPCWSIPSRSPW